MNAASADVMVKVTIRPFPSKALYFLDLSSFYPDSDQ